ncbi:MAG: DnaJ domain-containing protein [Chloroflexi bacterium]|nr:DnaJ domain-containing protein [Chloroflexota bacterium]
MPHRTYYRVLQVDPEAEPEVIQSAFRRLARKYHPDVNKSPDAVRRMQEINEAYEVLRDPSRRRAYDAQLTAERSRAEHSARGTQARNPAEHVRQAGTSGRQASAGDAEAHPRNDRNEPRDEPLPDIPLRCEGCGRSDATLRMVTFPRVISIVVRTLREKHGGVFCEDCRKRKMLGSKLVTLLLGWWGIPFGPILTLGVLFAPSQGQIPADANGAYLAVLGAHFLRQLRLADAANAWQASLGYRNSPQLAGLYQSVFNSAPKPLRTPSGSGSGAMFGLVALGLFGWVAVATGWFGLVPEYPKHPTYSAATPPVVLAAPTRGGALRSDSIIPPTATSPAPAPTSLPTPRPTSWTLPPMVHYSQAGYFAAQIPEGSEVEIDEVSGPDELDYRTALISPPLEHVREDMTFIVVHVISLPDPLADSHMPDKDMVVALARDWLDDREGWRTVERGREQGSLVAAWAEAVGEGRIAGDLFRCHYRILSTYKRLYAIEVIGLSHHDDRVAQYYDAFVRSFRPGN